MASFRGLSLFRVRACGHRQVYGEFMIVTQEGTRYDC